MSIKVLCSFRTAYINKIVQTRILSRIAFAMVSIINNT